MKFKPGDVVRHIAKGPDMTVDRTTCGGYIVKCVWFNKQHKLRRARFFVLSLYLVKSDG
jgi:uncharacterized protein YodC (DUF2158 family)